MTPPHDDALSDWNPERLRAAVDASGRSKKWLAARIGKHRNTVGDWLSGKAEPKATELAALCALVGITVQYALYLDD